MQYDALLAPLDGFEATVKSFRRNGGKGMNVTVPFKLEAYRLATRLTERATIAQAVNTLKFENDEILGDNTDGAGLVRDIESNLEIPIAGKRILLLGAGGAARGVILPLLQQKPSLLAIANRTLKKQWHFRNSSVPMAIASRAILCISPMRILTSSSMQPPPACTMRCPKYPPVFLRSPLSPTT